ncbi:MAG: hypothetical protein GEV13_03150 [Rhodospirillales bacterium]|nr:hypothetical protein [Rhodospirillales bacterium]
MGTLPDSFPRPTADNAPKLPEVPRADESTNEGVAMNVARDLERFVLGFVGGGAILRGAGVATNTLRGAAGAGFVGDFVVTGANDNRLVDLFEKVPALRGPFLEYISTDGDEDLLKHKLGAAVEGLFFGGAIDGLQRIAGVIRRSIKAEKTGGAEAAERVIQESAEEMQEAATEINAWSGAPSEAIDPGAPVATHPPVRLDERGQIEMFPEVVRREEAIEDIQLQIKGDRYLDPETGKEKLLPISNRAREELTSVAADPNAPLHIDKLTPETREELLRALASDNEAARFFNPKTVRGKTFALDDARRADFDAAMERSLSIPYATLKAENPGAAIEDTLSTFLNYRYMESADSVKVTLDEMATAMEPQVAKHLGGFPQTHAQVQETAGWLGMKPEVLLASLSQQARAAEHMPALLVAGKTWIQSLARDIHQISKAIDSGMATDTAKIELVRRQDILADLISTLKSVQTASARTTAAGRIRTSDALTHEEMGTLLREVGEDNFKLISRKLALTEGNPQAVISILEPTFGQKSWGVANEFWINAILSGPATHVINLTTGLRNTALFPLFKITGGLLTGDMKSVRIGIGQYAGLRGAVFNSFEMAKRSLLTENAYVDASFHQIERERLWIKADTFSTDPSGTLGQGIEALGTAIRMPSRFLTAEDEFLKQLTYRASVTARAHEEAIERGLSDNRTVSYFVDGEKKMISEVDEYVRDRMQEAFHPRMEHGLDQAALRDARRATFTSPLKTATWGNMTSLGEIAQQAAARAPWIRHTILPFTRVPTNIFREMILESPLAPIRKQFWTDLRAGGEARSDAIGRVALGTTFWTGAAMLASEGIITGKGPTDPKLQKQWRAAGNQPYSIRFASMGPDGKDLFISYNRFDPTAGVLALAADFAYIAAHVDERTQDALAMTLTLTLANNLNSRTYLRSLTELTSILGSNDRAGPHLVERWLNSRAASYVPRIVSAVNPDDTLRDARDALEAIQARIPGLSDGLPPRRDTFGEPIVPSVGWPYSQVNPFAIAVGKDGAARRELGYWAESETRSQFEMPSPKIDGLIDLRDAKNSQTGQSGYDRWLEILTEPRFGGKTAEERIDDIVASDGYRNLKERGVESPIYRRHPAVEFLREQLGSHYGIARELMLAEVGFEDLRAALQIYEASKRAVPVGAVAPSNPALDQLLKR